MTATRKSMQSALTALALTLLLTLAWSAPCAAQDLLIRGGTVLTITNGDLENTDVLIRNGKIAEIGQNLTAPEGVQVIDAAGQYVMPGIIDSHSHMGIDRGINEGSRSVVPEVRIADVIKHDDPAFFTALAGGITTIHTMHGSANTIGGQNESIKLKWGHPWEDLIIQEAPMTLKFALGENVRRSAQPNPTRYPRSRSGVAEVMRESFTEAQNYRAAWAQYEADKAAWDRANRRRRGAAPIPPKKNLQMEALVDAMEGNSIMRVHAYRSDEMAMVMEVAREFDLPPGVFEHALDAYQIAPEVAANGWATTVFADSWGYKIEAYQAIPYKMLIHYENGVRTSINSDSAERVRRLFQEAARGVKYGGLPENECLKMITINSALDMGIEDLVGSIEVGKDGDIAIFNTYPLHTTARVEMTIIEGEVYFDRSQTDVAADWVLDANGGEK
jgi:imidazolonepropionase-like amidohydrolase